MLVANSIPLTGIDRVNMPGFFLINPIGSSRTCTSLIVHLYTSLYFLLRRLGAVGLSQSTESGGSVSVRV